MRVAFARRQSGQPFHSGSHLIASVTNMTAPQQSIRTEPHPVCQLCGSIGDVLYEGLEDRLFTVPGRWSFRRCSNPACRHVWLDPQPIPADLPLIYEDYYTHGLAREKTRPFTATWLLRNLYKFGYDAFVRLSGLAHERKAAYEMYVGNRPPGRLLEIGCGSGQRLVHFAAKGWIVQGQDVDAKAVTHARASTGLPVHLGPIETLPKSAGLFDAVIMHHVIEHVPDPAALLRQVVTLMTPNGILVAITPNITSINHRRFQESWLALDPPRHLHLFSPSTLLNTAQGAGFRHARVRTSAVHADGLIRASLEIERAGRFKITNPGAPSLRVGIQTILLQIEAMIKHKLDPDSGEECVLMAETNARTPEVDEAINWGNTRRKDCGSH